MLEWPLCFLFGGVSGSATILIFLSLFGSSMGLIQGLYVISQTFAWFGVIAALILVGILSGSFVKATFNLVMGSLRIPH
jgi:hypothetical protein